MSGDGGRFLEACGATGPLELEWDDRESGEAARRGFDRPAVLVGRNPRGDLVLDHPGVSKRHAYLQVIEGRVHAIDLESRDGLLWSGVPRRSGWADRGRPMELGPVTVRVVGGDRPEGPGIGPGPLSRRYVPRQPLPEVALEIRDAGGEPTRAAMDRVLVLVGGSPLCKVPLPGPESSRFACALVRTPAGVWMVDLLSSRGVAVNGVACRDAWLDDGDVIRAGDRSIRLTYRSPAAAAQSHAEAGPLLPASIGPLAWPGRTATGSGDAAWELIPEMILRQLPDGNGGAAEASSAPFNQALLMLIRLLGEMHRDHLEVVRDEMEQIRRLNHEMGSLRSQLSGPGPADGRAESPTPALADGPDPGPAPEDPAPGRPDPRAVQAIVGRRLAAWEKERQSRWRKVMDLLVKP